MNTNRKIAYNRHMRNSIHAADKRLEINKYQQILWGLAMLFDVIFQCAILISGLNVNDEVKYPLVWKNAENDNKSEETILMLNVWLTIVCGVVSILACGFSR